MSDDTTELSREELLRRYQKKPAKGDADEKRRSPFKFLDSYGVEDADIFFGRDTEIDELMRHFHGFGHVLIYGESGCGKSSLVQCGLRSRIPEMDALFIPLRVHAAGLSMVSRQISEAASRALGEAIEVSGNSHLADSLPEIRAAASRPLVLFFDQFEELFIFHDADTRRRFAEELAAIQSARLNIKVIIGIRQDFLAHLSELEDIVEGVFENRFWLRRMSRENAVQAVVKACDTCDVSIDEGLVESILQRLDPGSQGVELPYLQVVMDRLFRQAVDSHPDQLVISAEDVERLGDIADILGTFLVEEVAKLPSPDTGRQILKAFVTRQGTRRSLDREAVAREAASFGEAIPPDELDAHLKQLSNVRILRETSDSETHELRHDALAATVSGWISQVEKELIEVRDNLINRFNEYEARGKPASALLDQSFLDYLTVYRKRLQPLLDEPLRQYLAASQRQVTRAKRIRQLAIAVGVVIVITVAFFVRSQQLKQKEEAEREQVRQKEEAEREKIMALIASTNEFSVTVSEDVLLNQPGMQDLRLSLFRMAERVYAEYLDGLGEGEKLEDDLLRELAQAHYYMGQITQATEGPEVALTSFERARDIQQDLASRHEQDSELLHDLGNTWNAIGNARDILSDNDGALKAYDEARRVREQLAKQHSDNSEYQRRLANTIMNVGLVKGENPDLIDEAIDLINEAQDRRRKEVNKLETQLKELEPKFDEFAEPLFNLEVQLADKKYELYELKKMEGDELEEYDEEKQKQLLRDIETLSAQIEPLTSQIRGVRSRIQSARGSLFRIQRDLAMGYYNRAWLENKRASGDWASTKSAYDDAIALFHKCLGSDNGTANLWGQPNDLEVRYMLGESIRMLADGIYEKEIWPDIWDKKEKKFAGDAQKHEAHAARLAEPEQYYLKAKGILESLAEDNPAVIEYQAAVARLSTHLGRLYKDWPGVSQEEKLVEAIELFDRAEKKLRDFKDDRDDYKTDWKTAESEKLDSINKLKKLMPPQGTSN